MSRKHGEHEADCLNALRVTMFCNNGQPRQTPFTHKTYLDISDNEFKNERIWLVNPECSQSYFGLVENDRVEFESIIRAAQSNPNASCFPDFIFENGFIEHFQITSSVSTRKGSTHTRKEREFRRKVDSETEEIKSEWNKTASFDAVRSKTWNFFNPAHSHEYLVRSFKRNWEQHMKSYKKYEGAKRVGVFMIEYPEFALAMHENVYQGWINGMSQGDMREQEEFKEYRLSRDKDLLQYVYQFKDEIKYVVFLNHTRFEVVCTENIPYLIRLLPWDYIIYPLCVNSVASIYNISVPMPPTKEGEEDENN